MRVFQTIGRQTITVVQESGIAAILLWRIVLSVPNLIRDRRLLLYQMMEIGVRSLPLVTFVAIFTGAVTAWQAAYQIKGIIPLTYLGGASSMAIFIELGPVLTGLVIAGRVGASIAAELGTMKVTEQIDALETLAIDPVRFLATPRVFASIFMMPVLVIYADAIALMGALAVANTLLGISAATFFEGVQRFFVVRNVTSGLAKAVVFGASTSLVGCYIGFQTSGGAEGVGKSTIKAFVVSSALILMNDYLMAMILF